MDRDPGRRRIFSTLQNCMLSTQISVCLRGAQAVVRGEFLTPASPPSNLPYGPQRPSHPGTCSQGRPGIFKKKIPSAGHGDQTFRRSHDRTF